MHILANMISLLFRYYHYYKEALKTSDVTDVSSYSDTFGMMHLLYSCTLYRPISSYFIIHTYTPYIIYMFLHPCVGVLIRTASTTRTTHTTWYYC